MTTNIVDLKSLTEQDLYNLINSDGNNEIKEKRKIVLTAFMELL